MSSLTVEMCSLKRGNFQSFSERQQSVRCSVPELVGQHESSDNNQQRTENTHNVTEPGYPTENKVRIWFWIKQVDICLTFLGLSRSDKGTEEGILCI